MKEKINIPEDIMKELIRITDEQEIDLENFIIDTLEVAIEELRTNKRFMYSDEKIIEINKNIINFLDISKDKKYKIIYLLSTEYNLKIKDILNLTNFEFDNERIIFRRKKLGGEVRVNITNNEVISYLEKHCDGPYGYIFKHKYREKISRIDFYMVIGRALKAFDYKIDAGDLFYRVKKLNRGSRISTLN